MSANIDRIRPAPLSNAEDGDVRWSPVKSLWWSAMCLAWLIGGTLYFSWQALGVFLLTSAITLCGGHSLGMHRKFIHDSFNCPKWLETIGVWLGTLVGLGGPYTMIYTHDIRDWAQRQDRCHPFLSHQSPMLKDFIWQIHCKLHFRNPPDFNYPDKLTQSRLLGFIQATSMLQQIPLAAALYFWGGLGFVFWGICGRVTVSIFGHWLIGYFAHNHGPRDWHVQNAAVQGHNVRFCGLITFGECWHNNHHAFPDSARIGLYKGQIDPGWWVLLALKKIGLIWDMKTPEDLGFRAELLQLKAHPSKPPIYNPQAKTVGRL